MKADLLTRLRQWSEKPNEGDPIIDAMAGDLQEALEFIEACDGWKPIETAPKDGTPIIAYNTRNTGHYPVVVRWKHEAPDSEVGPEPHWADAATFLGDVLYYNGLFFDRWRPLHYPHDASRLLPTPADDGGGAHEAAVVLRRRVDELAEKLAYEEDRRTEAENDRDRFFEGTVLLAKQAIEIAVERDGYQVALMQITKLKPEPIGETGFSTGLALILIHAQRIARDAIKRGAKR